MSRNKNKAAEAADAAAQASEAARTLAARSHEARAERTEKAEDPAPQREVTRTTEPGRAEKLLGNRPSVQAWDEILAKREKDEPKEEAAEDQKKEEKAEVKAEAPKEEPKPEPVAEQPAPEAPKTVKVKVDGEELDVPQADVDAAGGLAAYQRDKASEKRLKAANDALAEARRMQAEVAAFSLRQKPEPQPAATSQTDADFIASKLDLIRFGTPQEAAAAWLEVQNRSAPKQPDQNALVAQITNQIANQQAVERFKKDFSDVVNNPVLWAAAQAMDRDRRAKLSGPVDWNDFYGKLGADIRAAVPARPHQSATASPSPTAGTTSGPSEKEARKASSASITNLPTASARAEVPKEEKELTPDEERKAWIAEQKKARGLG